VSPARAASEMRDLKRTPAIMGAPTATATGTLRGNMNARAPVVRAPLRNVLRIRKPPADVPGLSLVVRSGGELGLWPDCRLMSPACDRLTGGGAPLGREVDGRSLVCPGKSGALLAAGFARASRLANSSLRGGADKLTHCRLCVKGADRAIVVRGERPSRLGVDRVRLTTTRRQRNSVSDCQSMVPATNQARPSVSGWGP
jgi:hypothetical protein